MRRVFFIAPSAYPLGGIAVWLDYLVRKLPSHGWRPMVGLVSGRFHDIGRYLESYPDTPWVGIDNPTGSPEGRLRSLSAAIAREAPDVVVGVNVADAYAAAQRVRQRGAHRFSTVMAIHAIAPDLIRDLREEHDHIDAVIGTNRLICKLCTEVGTMPTDRVQYAPYGVDVEKLGGFMRDGRGLGPLRIAYVGRFDHEQKQVRMIPRILAYLEKLGVDFRMNVAGDGPLRDELQDALAPWIVAGKARMLGSLAPDAIAETVYATTDALLITSAWETGPLVAWEAMAAGTVVVTSRYVGSGLEGSLRHDENCLMFPIGDAAEAAQQLERLQNPVLMEAVTRGGYSLVRRCYSIDQSVKSWAGALNTVVDVGPRERERHWPVRPPAGRLDRACGVGLAETLRKRIRRRFEARNPGAEWPHSLHPLGTNDSEFWNTATSCDGRRL